MDFNANAAVNVILTKRMDIKKGASQNTSIAAHISSIKRITLVLMLLIFGVLAAGCGQRNNGSVEELKELSADEITAAFTGQGLELQSMELREESIFQRELNGRKPLVFLLDEEELVIYQFAGDGEREDGWADFEKHTATADLVQHKVFQEQSLLMFYVHDEGMTGQVLFRQIEQVIPELLRLRES